MIIRDNFRNRNLGNQDYIGLAPGFGKMGSDQKMIKSLEQRIFKLMPKEFIKFNVKTIWLSFLPARKDITILKISNL